MNTGAFERFFGDLEDPRQSAKVAHLFSDILFLLVCASMQVPRAGKRLKTLVICTLNGLLTKACSRMVYQCMILSLVWYPE